MKKRIFIVGQLLLVFTTSLFCQKKWDYNDGPYIFKQKKKYNIEWISDGELFKTKLPVKSDTVFAIPGLPAVDLSKLSFTRDTSLYFDNVKKFAAISDVHGQYELFLDLLKAQNVIDSTGQWAFGEGHLVMVGDIFDRGPEVTECLWFIFNLEQEAQTAGGKVHFLLGNHEVMVLHGQVGYINRKYRYTAGITEREYQDFFSESTVLGEWLRSKNITVCINDFVFVHGGFSRAVIDREKSLKTINTIFQETIIPDADVINDTTALITELYFDNGPLWYRGYADPTKFDIKQAEYILDKLGKESIVIGHTSMPQVMSLHDNRIILVDSSIKFGESGEILIFDDDLLYRGLLSGERILLVSSNEPIFQRSIFDYLVDEYSHEKFSIKLTTDMDQLIKNKSKKEYQDATLALCNGVLDTMVFDVRVKVRGNMRKKVCSMPPLKIDFKKKQLNNFGFSSKDKLKFVLQCNTLSYQDKYLHKEKLIYDLYERIDSISLRTRLVNIDLIDTEGKIEKMKTFIVEDEDNFAQRVQGQIVERGVLRIEGLNREAYLKMVFFQYMIMNTDWSIAGRHNVETIKLKTVPRMIAVPYDFDYAGIVGQKYAVPSPLFDIESVDVRFFRGRYVTKQEFDDTLDFYNSIKEDLIQICNDAVYLAEKDRKIFIKEVEEFYKLINNPNRKKSFINKKKY